MVSRSQTLSFFFAIAAGAISCTSTGCSSTATADGGVADDALIDAPLDTTHTYSVAVCGGKVMQKSSYSNTNLCLGRTCTGTLVGPNLVLTARHCVSPMTQGPGMCSQSYAPMPFEASSVHVSLAASVVRHDDPQWLDVLDVLVPPGTNACADDIALLVLAGDVSPAQARPVSVDLDTDLAVSPPEEVTIIGRGAIKHYRDAAGKTVFDSGGYQRRISENIPFVCASNTDGGCSIYALSEPPPHIFELPAAFALLGPATAQGDSGAGVLDQFSFDADAPEIIGVISAGSFDRDAKPNGSQALRVSYHRDFLASSACKASASTGASVPSWVTRSLAKHGQPTGCPR